ncbi:MAG: galactokinase, partial [Verrucomicrobia bacterium]
KDPDAPWANYTKGLLLQLQQRGIRPGGFNALIHSTVPLGAGLSSSAALLVASALTVRKLYPYVLESDDQGRMTAAPAPAMTDAERLLLAKACQAAENRFVGVNCGLLDHISSLFGKAHHVIRIDCLHLTVDHAPLPEDVAVVVCHSGVRHALVGGEYNERRALCESAAAKLGVPALRFVDLEGLEAGRNKLTDREYGCALHVVGENDRVQRGAAALEAGDLETFGRFLYDSHESSRVNFLNSCPELDVLVELARQHPACIGARLSGGGFGGATFNLVRAEGAEAFRAHLLEGYRKKTGREAQAWICDVVDGAA